MKIKPSIKKNNKTGKNLHDSTMHFINIEKKTELRHEFYKRNMYKYNG